MLPTITTFAWVPEFARGFVRDMRPRWAFEEVGQPYAVNLITDSKSPEHRRLGDLETRLADLEAALGDNVWLDSNEFTVGDLIMISVLGSLRDRAELADFPRLAAYIARGETRPAHRKALADHMATFEAPVSA
jgi:glutathione S-transferase